MRTRILLLIAIFQLTTLAFGQKYNFWGTTNRGVGENYGSIFKTDTNGTNLSTEYSFPFVHGKFPNGDICVGPNGKVYGVTFTGVTNVNMRFFTGVIFEYDYQNHHYETIHEFSNDSLLGVNSRIGIMYASNGKLYGMTSKGGVNGEGFLYEFDLNTRTYAKRFDFGGINGAMPNGVLLEASNNKLYGVTGLGGVNNNGVLFEYDFNTNTYTKKVDFSSLIGCQWPLGSLMEAANGKLYGVSNGGGTLNKGTLFEYTISNNTLIKKADFNGTFNGEGPSDSPIQANNGKLYGVTYRGGMNDEGVLYEYDILNNTLISKFDFSRNSIGQNPKGRLIEVSNGVLYGLISEGGTSRNGILFEYNYLSDLATLKHEFNNTQFGRIPSGSIVKIANNKILSTLKYGGSNNYGELFEYNYSSNSFKKLIRFGNYFNTYLPKGKLTYADNGKLYGVTFKGGEGDQGCLFEFDPKTKKLSLKYEGNGFYPIGDLVNVDNNFLYGISLFGGSPNRMALFKYDYKNDSIIIVHSFGPPTGTLDNRNFSMFLHSNGKLYGIGKKVNSGFMSIFEFNLNTNTYSTLYEFQTYSPQIFLSEGPNGNIYGVKTNSGLNNKGFLFVYNLQTATFTNVFDFDGNNGSEPTGELLLGSNNKFYGVTTLGGINNQGVLFEFDISTNSFIKKLDFNGSNGSKPECGLSELNPGKMYGTTSLGGVNNMGTMYEYNYLTNTIQVNHSFDSANTGRFPMSKIIKATDCITLRNSFSTTSCISYTSPSGKYTWTNSGTYSDTLKVQGCDSIIAINLIVKKINNTVAPLGPTTLAANAFGATYQWLDCSNNYAIIPNETGQLFTATAIGNYAVELTANGCVDTSACYPITVVGISENQLSNNLAVFPNPTNRNVTLSLGGIYGALTTQVYNVHGMLINESTHQSANQVEVELGESEGIYFIHLITSSGEKVVRKVVKK